MNGAFPLLLSLVGAITITLHFLELEFTTTNILGAAVFWGVVGWVCLIVDRATKARENR